MNWRIFILTSSIFLLPACHHLSGSEQRASTRSKDQTPPKPVFRPIPANALYSLLKAEFAGQRKLPEITLEEYRHLASETRDVGVAKRAALIAQYLNADEDTLAHAELWSELEPDSSDAQNLVSSQLIKQNKLNEAFDHSLTLLDKGMTPLFQTIALQAARQDTEVQHQLLDRFRQGINQYPQNSELLTGEALLLHSIGDTERALNSIEQAIDADNNNTAAYVLKAALLEKLGEKKEAAAVLRKQVKKQPDNQRLRLQYARILTEVDLKEAQNQFHILQQTNPLDPDILLSLALVSKELDESDTAKEYFEQLLFLRKYTSSAYYYLGQISEQQADKTRALELYRRVTDGTEYLYAAAATCRLYIEQDELHSCQEYMQAERGRLLAINNPPQDFIPSLTIRLYLIEADLFHRQKALVEELGVLNQALEKFPHQNELLYARSVVYEQAHNTKAAEDDLRTILSREPDNVDALNALGYTLVNKTERIQEGYELITRALALQPNNPAIIDSMGWALYRLNRNDEAIPYLQQAMKSFPNHEIAAHLGEVLWASGQKDAARKVWLQGLEDDANSEIIQSTQDRLEAH